MKGQPLVSLIFAAAGFYYDHGCRHYNYLCLGYFVFTSEERTRKVIGIIKKHQIVGSAFRS